MAHTRTICVWVFCIALVSLLVSDPTQGAYAADSSPVRGLWAWKGPTVLKSARDAEKLRDFCQDQGINEVYVSISERGQMMPEDSMSRTIDVLHRANIRVEALFSSENADEGGNHLEKLLGDVRAVVQFNQKNPRERFDGIHLDIEPQQRPENKGAGNLGFLPGLVEAYRAVRRVSEPAGLTVNADIQNKLLKGSLEERRMLLSALPRLTLMMYELSSPSDGDSTEKKAEKASSSGKKFLDMAYQDLSDAHLAKMVIALRTPDYDQLLPKMLAALDEANRANPHYLGWARHSYNDTLQ